MEHVNSVKDKDIVFTSNATTDGRLLKLDRLHKMANVGVSSYQISFEAGKEEHEKLRVTVDHKGTFDTIWKNIVDTHGSNIKFDTTIRLYVNKNNEQSMKRMLQKIRRDLDGDERFSMFIRPLSRLGSQNDQYLPIADDKDLVSRLKDFAKNLGLRTVKKMRTKYVMPQSPMLT